jgi:Ser/Thr protein kinase RdoA (MazF antagonist)
LEVEHSQLRHLLIHEYGVTPLAISPGPRGFVALTYIVDAANGQRSFVKVLPPAPHLVHLPSNLALLAELRELGIAVNQPLRTRTGQWTVALGEQTVVVFDYISGRDGGGFDYDFAEYVALLAGIHQATSQVHTNLAHEEFRLPFAADMERYLARLSADPPVSPVQANLRRLLAPYSNQMQGDWSELQALAEACRQTQWAPRITHSDGNGSNVVMGDDGRLYLVDWDEVMLGPAERDTWFHLNAKARTKFLHLYRQAFPDYQPEALRYRFYVFRRYFEDLTGYLIEIADSASVAHQANNLADLEITCFQWLWPLMHGADATRE